jgi:flagellar biogenesis protein FliO
MDALRDVVSVLAVFALLGGALWTLRRGAGASLPRAVTASLPGWPGRPAAQKGGSIETVQRMALTPQHSLHLVRINGRELVVATHPHGCALLLETSGESQ